VDRPKKRCVAPALAGFSIGDAALSQRFLLYIIYFLYVSRCKPGASHGSRPNRSREERVTLGKADPLFDGALRTIGLEVVSKRQAGCATNLYRANLFTCLA